jgi:hypothetical protein
MPATYTLISSNVLSSSAASVTFSAIPATYTDLVLKYSIRTNVAGIIAVSPSILLNGSSSAIYSDTYLRGNGSAASTARQSNQSELQVRESANDTGSTNNTFSSAEIYIPSYTVSQNKPISFITATENNATAAEIVTAANLFRSTSAISSIGITIGAGAYNLDAGSSFYLYGISNA